MSKMTLRVLVMPSALTDTWLAVCIDRYMVAEGDTPENAATALDRVFRAELAYGMEHGNNSDPLDRLPPAPDKYHEMFKKAISPPPPVRHKRMKSISLDFEQRLAAAATA